MGTEIRDQDWDPESGLGQGNQDRDRDPGTGTGAGIGSGTRTRTQDHGPEAGDEGQGQGQGTGTGTGAGDRNWDSRASTWVMLWVLPGPPRDHVGKAMGATGDPMAGALGAGATWVPWDCSETVPARWRVLSGCWMSADMCPHAGPARGAPMELLGGPELADLVASLPGFLLAVTREGKLVGVTDNVAQHLGHSMVGTHTRGRGWVLSPLGAGGSGAAG